MPRLAHKSTAGKRIDLLRASNLTRQKWVVHGFSTRHGGVSSAYGKSALNLGFTEHDTRANVKENRRRFLDALSESRSRANNVLVSLRQVHGDRIHFFDATPKAQLAGDGAVTNVPAVVLAIQTADCLPMLLADPVNQAVGAFHAGWRGTLARIVQKGVGEMQRRFGTAPKDVIAAIGPGIHACCYKVGEEVREKFHTQFSYAAELFHEVSDSDPVHQKYPLLFLTARAPGHSELGPELHLDLVEANRRQLLDAGVLAKTLEASPLCTACRTDVLFSHRAEHGNTGRMLAAIGVR
ncbi:MAG TPA: peptidoglycan editing factor PgeF [Terriglobales bacterium]|nr:peptidoglycan editing factor PgeF [Terriglobales bacterium]